MWEAVISLKYNLENNSHETWEPNTEQSTERCRNKELDVNYICEILVRYSNTRKWTDTRESGLRNTNRLYRIGDNYGWSSSQTWYRLNWQWANNESTCNNTKVSNVKWISTTILPVYSCCYYYRSLVSIDYPDRRLWRHDPWKLRTDTRYDQSTNSLMRVLFYKGMRRLRSRRRIKIQR